MSLLERIDAITKLWETMLPHCQKPSAAWIGRWAEASPDLAIERGIVRASKKFSPERMDSSTSPETIHRYVSGVIRNESQIQRMTQ